MSDRDKKLLVYLGSLLILAAAYFFVVRPFLDKIDVIQNEKTQLEGVLNDKRRALNMKPEYESQLMDAKIEMDKIVGKFPADIPQEKAIMFIYNTENNLDIDVPQINFSDDADFTVDGENLSEREAAAEQAAVAANDEDEANEEGSPADNMPMVESITNPTGIADMVARTTQIGMSFNSNYSNYKKLLEFIRDYEERMVITSMDISSDGINGLSGSMVLSQYALASPSRELAEFTTGKEDALGKDNIFANDSLSLYDETEASFEENDDEEENNARDEYDYSIVVDAVSDNSNGVTIGRAQGDVSGQSYLTSNKNGSEKVVFTVTGEDGDYYVSYSVAGQDYTDEAIEKGEGDSLNLKILSNYRVNNKDDVNIKLSLINESDIELVATIVSDDPDNPRVDINEKDGNVTVK